MAAAEERQLEEMLRASLRSQDLNPVRIAAFSELCDRMLLEDPSNVSFVARMADVANEGQREANRRGADDIPWAALERVLRESVGRYTER